MARIWSNLKRLMLKKGGQDGQKVTYEVIEGATGLSRGVLVRLGRNEFKQVDCSSLVALCGFFQCELGDLLIYDAEDKAKAVSENEDLEGNEGDDRDTGTKRSSNKNRNSRSGRRDQGAAE